MSRLTQRTAKRQRAAWRFSGKRPLVKGHARKIRMVIVPAKEAESSRHCRTMVQLHMSGSLPDYGKPLDWSLAECEARRNAVLALRQWRGLGELALAGCLDAQVAIAAIAADAGIENPLEVPSNV